MSTRYFRSVPAVLALVLMLVLGANYAAFGQKDHGNGKHGGENRGDDGDRGNGKGRGWQKHDDQRWQNSQGENGGNNGRGNGNGRWKQRNENRPVYTVPYPQQAPYYGGGWVPPGQIRSQQVHERNAERKYLKDQEKAYRRYSRGDDNDQGENEQGDRRYYGQRWQDRIPQIYQNYNPNQFGYDPRVDRYQQVRPVYPYQPGGGYYSPNQYYYPNTYGYNQDPYYYGGYPNQYGGGSLKSTIIRMLLSNVLGNVLGGGGRNSYLNQYDPYAYGPVNYSYNQPVYYNGGYAPQYAGYGVPQYGGYSPYSGGLLGASPLGGLLGQGGGTGGYVTQVLSQVLAQGYLQGMLAGQSARQSGYGDRYYNDPYNTAVSSYCPYSSSMDQNRQLLSEGYNLGFQDALNGRNPYQSQSYGKADLVSLLLSNVLRAG